jgi:hypothetical protein
MLLEWGQPLGGVIQFAYVVGDIEAAQRDYSALLGVGPWFVRARFVPPHGLLRGQPHTPTITLARGFSGHTMIELICQHDDGPSVFHPAGEPRRYGFHHWATMSDRFEDTLVRYARAGFSEAFSDTLPSGSRVVYLERRAASEVAGMIEVIEYTRAQEQVYAEMFRAAAGS